MPPDSHPEKSPPPGRPGANGDRRDGRTNDAAPCDGSSGEGTPSDEPSLAYRIVRLVQALLAAAVSLATLLRVLGVV